MITSLDIKNFKVWRDTKKINFAPITVFFGANSAGETSIPQLLLLLKQTAESPDRQRALQLGDSLTLMTSALMLMPFITMILNNRLSLNEGGRLMNS